MLKELTPDKVRMTSKNCSHSLLSLARCKNYAKHSQNETAVSQQ